MIARQDDGSLFAFHNVCRHRGSRIVSEGGHCEARRLTCPFHGFTYDLEGNVIDVPERDTFDPAHLEELIEQPLYYGDGPVPPGMIRATRSQCKQRGFGGVAAREEDTGGATACNE